MSRRFKKLHRRYGHAGRKPSFAKLNRVPARGDRVVKATSSRSTPVRQGVGGEVVAVNVGRYEGGDVLVNFGSSGEWWVTLGEIRPAEGG